MQVSSFRGFTPIHSPCVFVNPIDGASIYPYGTFVCVEEKSGRQSFLRGPSENISCMDLSPKGRMIAAGEHGLKSDVFVWKYADKSLLYRFSEHDDGIKCLAFSQDERLLATYGEEGRLVIWDMATGNIVCHHQIRPAETIEWGGRVPDVKNRPTPTFYLATAGPSGVQLHVIDPAKGHIDSQMLPQGKYTRTVTAFAFTKEHLICATTSSDMLVFELHSRTLVNTVQAGSGGISDLYTDLNTGSITASCGDGTVWSVSSTGARQINQIEHPIAGLSGSTYLTRDGLMYTDKDLLWQSHSVPVSTIDACGSVSVSAGSDRTIKVWNNNDMSCTLSFDSKFRSSPSCLSLSTTLLVCGFENGALGGFDFTTGERLFEILHCHHTKVSAVEIAPTRRFFATGGQDTAVRIWDVRTREMMTHFKNHTMDVTSLRFLPSSQYLYSASSDMSVCLFDVREEKMIERLTQFESHVTDIDIAGDYLVTVTQDGHIQKFCVSQGTKAVASVKSAETTCMAVSPDGSRFAVGHVDGNVSLWDFNSFRKIDSINVHSHSVSDIRFFANNRVMTSGSDGGLAVLTVQ